MAADDDALVPAPGDIPGLFDRLQADPRGRQVLDALWAAGEAAVEAAWQTLKDRIMAISGTEVVNAAGGNIMHRTASDSITLTDSVSHVVVLAGTVQATATVHAPTIIVENAAAEKLGVLRDGLLYILAGVGAALAATGVAHGDPGTGRSTRAGSSTSNCRSIRRPTATGPWTSDRPSRRCCTRDGHHHPGNGVKPTLLAGRTQIQGLARGR